jgi:hypothetical protein
MAMLSCAGCLGYPKYPMGGTTGTLLAEFNEDPVAIASWTRAQSLPCHIHDGVQALLYTRHGQTPDVAGELVIELVRDLMEAWPPGFVPQDDRCRILPGSHSSADIAVAKHDAVFRAFKLLNSSGLDIAPKIQPQLGDPWYETWIEARGEKRDTKS